HSGQDAVGHEPRSDHTPDIHRSSRQYRQVESQLPVDIELLETVLDHVGILPLQDSLTGMPLLDEMAYPEIVRVAIEQCMVQVEKCYGHSKSVASGKAMPTSGRPGLRAQPHVAVLRKSGFALTSSSR